MLDKERALMEKEEEVSKTLPELYYALFIYCHKNITLINVTLHYKTEEKLVVE